MKLKMEHIFIFFLMLVILILLFLLFLKFSGSGGENGTLSFSPDLKSSLGSFVQNVKNKLGGSSTGLGSEDDLPKTFKECYERNESTDKDKADRYDCLFSVRKDNKLYSKCADLGGNTYGGRGCSFTYYNPNIKFANDYAGCKAHGGDDGKSSQGSGGKIYATQEYCSYKISNVYVYPDNLSVAQRLYSECVGSGGIEFKTTCKLEVLK